VRFWSQNLVVFTNIIPLFWLSQVFLWVLPVYANELHYFTLKFVSCSLHFGTVFYLVFYFLCITSSVSRTSHFLVSTFFYHFLMIKMVMWQDHAKDLLKAINESLLTHPQIYQLFHNELEVQDNSHQNHLRLQRQHLKSQKQNNVRGSNEKLMINTWQQWVKIVINIT